MITSWLLVVVGITVIAILGRRARRRTALPIEPFAVVDQVWWSGVSLGQRTVVGLRLTVHLPTGDEFRAQATLRVPQGHEGWIFPGARLDVRLHGADDREIELLPPIPLDSRDLVDIPATILSPASA